MEVKSKTPLTQARLEHMQKMRDIATENKKKKALQKEQEEKEQI